MTARIAIFLLAATSLLAQSRPTTKLVCSVEFRVQTNWVTTHSVIPNNGGYHSFIMVPTLVTNTVLVYEFEGLPGEKLLKTNIGPTLPPQLIEPANLILPDGTIHNLRPQAVPVPPLPR